MSIMRRKEKQKNKTLIVLGIEVPLFFAVFLCALFVCTIFFAIESTVLGSRLAALEKKGADLANKNTEVSNRLVQSTSLNNVQERSDELGFVKPENIIYITKEDVVARLP